MKGILNIWTGNKRNKLAILLAAIIMGGLSLLLFVPVGSEQIIITNKEIKSEFRCSGALSFFSCGTNYSYFVNGKHEPQSLYNEVEEGKIYNCDKSIIGTIIRCKESE